MQPNKTDEMSVLFFAYYLLLQKNTIPYSTPSITYKKRVRLYRTRFIKLSAIEHYSALRLEKITFFCDRRRGPYRHGFREDGLRHSSAC